MTRDRGIPSLSLPHPSSRTHLNPWMLTQAGNAVKDCFSHPHASADDRDNYPQSGALSSKNHGEFMKTWDAIRA